MYVLDRDVLSKGSWWNSEGDHSQKGQSVFKVDELALLSLHIIAMTISISISILLFNHYPGGKSLPRWCSHPLTNWTCATLAGDFQCFWPVHTGDGSMPMGLWKWGAWTSRMAPFFDSRFSGFCPVQPGVLVMKHPKGLYLGLLAIQGAHTNYPIFFGWMVIDITAHHLLDWFQLDGPKMAQVFFWRFSTRLMGKTWKIHVVSRCFRQIFTDRNRKAEEAARAAEMLARQLLLSWSWSKGWTVGLNTQVRLKTSWTQLWWRSWTWCIALCFRFPFPCSMGLTDRLAPPGAGYPAPALPQQSPDPRLCCSTPWRAKTLCDTCFFL